MGIACWPNHHWLYQTLALYEKTLILENKTIWIIGGTHGIGRALSLKLAEKNSVVVSGRSLEALKELEAQTNNLKGMLLDVSKGEDIDRTLTKVLKFFGTLDILIYAAGIYERGPFGTLSTRTLKDMLTVNLLGAIHVVNEILPVFKKQHKGSIILFGSVAGYRGLPNASTYGISKAGILHMAETLKQDLKDTPIQTHLISPGFVETRLTKKNNFYAFSHDAQKSCGPYYKGSREGDL